MPEKETFANVRRQGLESKYDHDQLVGRIQSLLKEHNESYREASLKSDLDHQAIRRVISGQRPAITACILLANHWGVHPNELITLAGWPSLSIFDIETTSAEKLPPEAVEVAQAVAKIGEPNKRKRVAEAILTLMSKYFEA